MKGHSWNDGRDEEGTHGENKHMTTSAPNGLRICLITTPLPEGLYVLVENFLSILAPLANEIYLVTGNFPEDAIGSARIHLRNISYDHRKQSALIRIVKNFIGQLKLSYGLARIIGGVDAVIFFLATPLVLPMLAAKLLRRKVIVVGAGSWSGSTGRVHSGRLLDLEGRILPWIVSLEERLNYRLCDRIVVLSPGLIQAQGLEKHRDKTSVAHCNPPDLREFRVQRPLGGRENLVGYIGRLSEEKGILNLMEAISALITGENDIQFLIGGDGPLRSEVEEHPATKHPGGRVDYAGWVPYDRVPDILNRLKLLVLPSYSEGLPTIMLEAMACGAVVLATPVGGIPDIIRDGETGFIMEDNSAECIARSIVRVLDNEDLEQVAGNARALVEKEYTYEAAVEKYGSLLSQYAHK